MEAKMGEKPFQYSINLLTLEQQSDWNMVHTLQEIKDQRVKLNHNALAGIPVDELPQWILVSQLGLLYNNLHDVYIAFPLTWLFTKTGRRRRVSRALRMMGVPFVKYNGAEVIAISGLK